ncbi:hypothetical protein HAHE_10980 [Haloferula helveola]|uniref:Thioredoxin n=1 Tax=Haloferula helveola TaxID=490095 RepID=A0ABM7RHV3_9BACT|nr:hypothetical protein HAHE_10980 [Haloferula helveola]
MRIPLLLFGLVAFATSGCEKVLEALKSESSTGTAQGTGDADFDQQISQSGQVVVVDFYADWCGPCRSLGPKLERISHSLGGKVSLVKVNIDEKKALASSLNVSSIPDVRMYIDGEEVDRFVGDMPEAAVRQKIEAQASKVTGVAGVTEPGAETPGEEKAPIIEPMEKDWLPPGMEKK